MFCSNCGKEIAEGSSFCSACGAAIGTAQGKKEIGAYLKTPTSRLLLLLSNALIVWLGFQKFIVMDAGITYGEFTAIKFLQYAKKADDWGMWDSSALYTAGIFVLLMNLAIIALAASFCIKEALDHENKVDWGYNAAEAVTSITIVAIVISFFTSKEGFSVAANVYIILALAAANRWWLLPKYASEEYWRKNEEKKREREMQQQSKQDTPPVMLQESRWECTACGEENSSITKHCQNCGTYKYR